MEATRFTYLVMEGLTYQSRRPSVCQGSCLWDISEASSPYQTWEVEGKSYIHYHTQPEGWRVSYVLIATPNLKAGG